MAPWAGFQNFQKANQLPLHQKPTDEKSHRGREPGGVMGDGLDTIIYLFFRPADQPLSMFVLPSQYFRHSGIPFCNFYELINSKKSVQCVARKSKKTPPGSGGG